MPWFVPVFTSVLMSMPILKLMLVISLVPGFLLMLVPVLMLMPMGVMMRMRVGMRMAMRLAPRPGLAHQRRSVFLGRHAINPGRPGLPASAILTHYEISIESNSISRPRRNSPLTLPQVGHSHRNSGDSNSVRHDAHHIAAGTVSISSRALAAGVPGRSASNANSSASVTTPDNRPTLRRTTWIRVPPAARVCWTAVSSVVCMIPYSCT
jgi:hypothetical protein